MLRYGFTKAPEFRLVISGPCSCRKQGAVDHYHAYDVIDNEPMAFYVSSAWDTEASVLSRSR